MAATLTVLAPGQRYKVAKNGGSNVTVAKAAGVSIVPNAGVLRAVGDTITVADGYLWTSTPLEASVDNGTVTPTDGAVSAVSGATAALRRVINTTSTTAVPSAATDGYACEGFAMCVITLESLLAGNVKWHLWAYDSISAKWLQILDNTFGTTGDITTNASTARVLFNCYGFERLALEVNANPGSNQSNAWFRLVPQATAPF